MKLLRIKFYYWPLRLVDFVLMMHQAVAREHGREAITQQGPSQKTYLVPNVDELIDEEVLEYFVSFLEHNSLDEIEEILERPETNVHYGVTIWYQSTMHSFFMHLSKSSILSFLPSQLSGCTGR